MARQMPCRQLVVAAPVGVAFLCTQVVQSCAAVVLHHKRVYQVEKNSISLQVPLSIGPWRFLNGATVLVDEKQVKEEHSPVQMFDENKVETRTKKWRKDS